MKKEILWLIIYICLIVFLLFAPSMLIEYDKKINLWKSYVEYEKKQCNSIVDESIKQLQMNNVKSAIRSLKNIAYMDINMRSILRSCKERSLNILINSLTDEKELTKAYEERDDFLPNHIIYKADYYRFSSQIGDEKLMISINEELDELIY